MKKNKLILLFIISFGLYSCGAPDGTSEDSDGVAPLAHRIFVTSTTHAGNIGATRDAAIAAANAICASRATAANLVRTYKAILSFSDSGADKGQAADRLNITGEIYIFTATDTKLLVAANEADFWASDSALLLNSVSYDEAYNSVAGQRAWTGSNSNGGLGNSNCSDFTSTGTTSWYGLTNSKDDQFIEANTENCSNTYHLYCISQAD